MRRRHPLPRLWLMTDERMPDLCAVIDALPRGSGIIFRHYSLAETPRRRLFEQALTRARVRRHVMVLADTPARARAWGADGAHHRSHLVSKGIRTVPVHNPCERRTARLARADLIFASPVFETRSHPGARALGVTRLGLLAGNDRGRAIALGGMDGARFKRLCALGLYGWAGIDAFKI